MNKTILFFGAFCFFILFRTSVVIAQSLAVGTPVIEDYYRRAQLLGNLDSSVSFTIRPLFPAAAFGKENIYDPEKDFNTNNILSYSTISKSVDGKSMIQLLPIIWQQQYNTHNPYGWNDGAMIPAAGYESLFSPGIFLKYKFLSVRLQPEFVYAQNKNFDGFTQAGNDAKAWQAWYSLYNEIDLPERFGTTPYSKLLPGQSSIRITFDPVSFGLSTENLWWGPGVQSALVMSNTATGFPHLTLNTTRPVKTPIGSFEAQLISGRLVGSGYSPLVPGQPGNYDSLYEPKLNDWRYLNAGVISWQPKWVPGLFLGATRAFDAYHSIMGHGIGDYLPVLLPFFKVNNYDANTGIDTQEAAGRDEVASVFGRWLWTDANAEIYFEYGKEDFNWDLRDLLLDPEHSRAYILGFKKLIKINDHPDENVEVGIEETQTAKPADDVEERNSTPSWYANPFVRSGFTNNGEVLGAGIGPGSTLESLDVNWFKGLDKFGLRIQRYEHNADLYYDLVSAGEVRRHWVDYSVALDRDWTWNHFIFSATLLYVRELNYEWEFQDNPNLFYFSQPTFDVSNFKLSFSAVYRF